MAERMISKGKAKFKSKVDALGGASAWYSCGEKGGIEVAICLRGLKKKLTSSDWADAWETAMKAR